MLMLPLLFDSFSLCFAGSADLSFLTREWWYSKKTTAKSGSLLPFAGLTNECNKIKYRDGQTP
jgi:hypothetical protein